MVSNKSFIFACLLGLIATSCAYPAAERAESEVETTVRSLNDDIGEDSAVTATTEQVILSDEASAATTELNVRSENLVAEPEQNNVITVEEVVVPVEKTAPVVITEVVESNKSGPVVEVVEVVPVENIKIRARAMQSLHSKLREWLNYLVRRGKRGISRRVRRRRRGGKHRSRKRPQSPESSWLQSIMDPMSHVDETLNDYDSFWIADKRKGIAAADDYYNFDFGGYGGSTGYEDR